MIDLDALRKVAEAAEPLHEAVPQRVDIDHEGTCDGCAETKPLVASYPEPGNDPWVCADCAAETDFYVALDPPTVLALLDELAALRETVTWYRALPLKWLRNETRSAEYQDGLADAADELNAALGGDPS